MSHVDYIGKVLDDSKQSELVIRYVILNMVGQFTSFSALGAEFGVSPVYAKRVVNCAASGFRA
jgi:hypothetical protein